ncbi:uncharacterized protein BDZ99DRAFT_517180 [Mytilinidion resinicola]|uniref:Methyltransferase domain-containing protein n=1 Tax=Mytilinidion resinicola TaxID=574789 RepID=A0A6A6YVP1_9PEZI|nr:uncharacterized protein BDZ99DRAFT_517180 [Mytilinidion resinicola]KAF2812871.1 hypothetical protein BDZ99DRAFT_517180 [Mytilinidion resinicola]
MSIGRVWMYLWSTEESAEPHNRIPGSLHPQASNPRACLLHNIPWVRHEGDKAFYIMASSASPLPDLLLATKSDESEAPTPTDEWDTTLFAFHDLDYVPSGYGGILAPYIETGPGTMRAAVKLMGLDLVPNASLPFVRQVICDLGSGDGEFLIGLLGYVNAITNTTTTSAVHGMGIDYNAALIDTANVNAISAGVNATWLIYDFNEDQEDLVGQLVAEGVTHVFTYLVPKQLALKTVRAILTRLCESGVMVCCHKFQPNYLTATRRDTLMDLAVYEHAPRVEAG